MPVSAIRAGLLALALPLVLLTTACATAAPAAVGPSPTDLASLSDMRVSANAARLFGDAGSPVLGNPQGDVTIVQFYDYNCPFTRAVEPRVEALLKADPGVRLILKPFTIEPIPSSVVAARAALAAARQGKLEAFHQSMLVLNGGRSLTTQAIFDQAGAAGLDMERLRREMDAPAAYEQLIANFNLARALRVFETPTFIIGGHIVTEPSARIDFPKLVAEVRAKQRLP